MQLQSGLFIILLLCASCSSKRNTESPNKDGAQSASKQTTTAISEKNEQDRKKSGGPESIKPKTSQSLSDEGSIVGKKTKQLDNVDKIDAGVEIIPVTPQLAEKMGLKKIHVYDPGFAKWLISFHDIPDTPPYSFEQKRLLQQVSDRYYPLAGPSSDTILDFKNHNEPAFLVVSVRGYLPGEKITIRLSAKDAYREITFYPRPLHLKDKTGKLLAKADLLCAQPGHTFYSLDICGMGKEQKYKLTSYSGNEVLSHNMQGPIQYGITPEVLGQVRGIANQVFQFEDGTSYSLELPWGLELMEYKAGNK